MLLFPNIILAYEGIGFYYGCEYLGSVKNSKSESVRRNALRFYFFIALLR